jgi:hypothetical protein
MFYINIIVMALSLYGGWEPQLRAELSIGEVGIPEKKSGL